MSPEPAGFRAEVRDWLGTHVPAGPLTKVRALAGAWGSQAEHRARVMAAMPAWS